jgi:hypothetical protein
MIGPCQTIFFESIPSHLGIWNSDTNAMCSIKETVEDVDLDDVKSRDPRNGCYIYPWMHGDSKWKECPPFPEECTRLFIFIDFAPCWYLGE